MIPEGSCDTKNWSNDAENSAWSSQEYISYKNNYKTFKQKTVILN